MDPKGCIAFGTIVLQKDMKGLSAFGAQNAQGQDWQNTLRRHAKTQKREDTRVVSVCIGRLREVWVTKRKLSEIPLIRTAFKSPQILSEFFLLLPGFEAWQHGLP